jgi:hypothetical protein
LKKQKNKVDGKKPKKYDNTWNFQIEWATKLPCAKGVVYSHCVVQRFIFLLKTRINYELQVGHLNKTLGV